MNDRTAWLEERRKGIGSSDAPAIFGVCPFSTAVDVWLDKTRQIDHQPETPAMKAGTALEGLAVEMAADKLGQEIERHPQSESMEHHAIPVLRATPDAWVRTGPLAGWIVECKVTRDRPWDGVPQNYAVQVQHQLAVTGAPGAIVAQLSRGDLEIELLQVPRHDGAIARIERDLPAWWGTHVIGGVAPDPKTVADVIRIFPRPTAGLVRLDDEALALADELQSLAANRKAITEREKAIKAAIARTLGPAEAGILPDGRAWTFRTRKAHHRKAVDVPESRSVRVAKQVPKGVDLSRIREDAVSVVWHGDDHE